MEDLEENLEMENAGQPLTPEEVGRIAHITQRLANDPREFLGHLEHISACAESQSAPFHQAPSQTPAPPISPEIIATITATVMAAMKNQNPIPATLHLPQQYQVDRTAGLRSSQTSPNTMVTWKS